MSGPIDLVLVHQETGETRYIDVKYKKTRQGTKTMGRRINRVITSPLKKCIKIEIVYVESGGKVEFPIPQGRSEWAKKYKIDIYHLRFVNCEVHFLLLCCLMKR